MRGNWSTLKKLIFAKASILAGGGSEPSHDLPEGYRRLKGFNYTGANFDITGFKMRGSDTLRFSFIVKGASSYHVIGAYDGSLAQTNFNLYCTALNVAEKNLRYDGGQYYSYTAQNVRYDAVISPTGTSGLYANSTWEEKTFESGNDLFVGASSPTTKAFQRMQGDIIGPVEVDGRLYLIPCEREADNALGYYDTYSETFFEPISSGLSSLGYEDDGG